MNGSTQGPAGKAKGREAQFIAERVRTIAAPIVQSLGVELFDVECVGQGGRTLVRVLIDKPGGVNLEDCQQVHTSLGHALDVEDPIPHSYTLEVSSPGIDRPFKQREQYRRALGKPVNLKLRAPINGQWRMVGTLRDVREDGITLSVGDARSEQILEVSWDTIVEGRQEITF